MIVFDGFELIGLAIMALPFVILGIIRVIDRILYAVRKLIVMAFKQEDEQNDS